MIHEVWDLDNTVYRKCIMALKGKGKLGCLMKIEIDKGTIFMLKRATASLGFPLYPKSSLCAHAPSIVMSENTSL